MIEAFNIFPLLGSVAAMVGRNRQEISSSQHLRSEFERDGYLVLRQLVPRELLDAVREEVLREYSESSNRTNWHPDGYSSGRFQDAWRRCPAVSELASLPKILQILYSLVGREPHPFQTLTFSEATQQRAHSDHIHFSSYPLGMMCGVWVAIEKVTMENGPLFYYPGSHRLPYKNYEDFGIEVQIPELEPESYSRYEEEIERSVSEAGYQRQQFAAEPGDVLIWHANLVHGGSVVTGASASRWSQVTHYYFDDCIHFTPRYSQVNQELFFRTPVDLCSGLPIRSLILRSEGKAPTDFEQTEFRRALDENSALRSTLESILSSKSWQWTAWIRRLFG